MNLSEMGGVHGLHLHTDQPILPGICKNRLCRGREAAAGRAEPEHGGAVCVPGLFELGRGLLAFRQKAARDPG